MPGIQIFPFNIHQLLMKLRTHCSLGGKLKAALAVQTGGLQLFPATVIELLCGAKGF